MSTGLAMGCAIHDEGGCREVPRGQVLRPRAAHFFPALPVISIPQRGRSYVSASEAQSGRAGGNKFGRAKGCRAAWILPVGVSEEVVECGGRGTAAADVLTGPTSSQACGVGEQAGSRIMCSEAGQDEIDGVAADRMGRRAR